MVSPSTIGMRRQVNCAEFHVGRRMRQFAISDIEYWQVE
jgi:hypothetical protein